jgi:hypothetical protein
VNGSPDVCDVFAGGDCNRNSVPDDCDLASGSSADRNADKIPDECQGACCSCSGCVIMPEIDCRLSGLEFGGNGSLCSDENICHLPPVSGGECAGAIPLPGISHQAAALDNRCVAFDEIGSLRCDDIPLQFGAELWYTYQAPCTGTLRLDACQETGFDVLMAIYGGPTSCTCELRDRLLACGDNECGAPGGGAMVELPVVGGRCYMIRVGGWEGDRGQGRLNIEYLTPCSSADLNDSGLADLADFAIFQRCFGRKQLGSTCSRADLNEDGTVNLGDYELYFASLPN